MKKEEFLKNLSESLNAFSAEEREDIVRDQDEYIRDAVAAGREEEAVVNSLGDPKAFASQLTVQTKIDQAQASKDLREQVRNVFGAVLAILTLAPFNVIFVLGPFMAVVGLNVAGWAVSFALVVVSLVLLAAFIFKLAVFSVGMYTHLSALFLCMGVVCLGCLGFVVMFYFTRFFMTATASYLRWNLKLLKGRV